MAGNGYARQIEHVQSKLDRTGSISPSDPHAQTLLRAARQGDPSARAFVANSGLQGKMR